MALPPADMGTKDVYINADMEYKAADSVMISAAKRGCFEAPGIRDTRRIWVTMIMVETVVVVTDNITEEIRRALITCGGNQTGDTARAKIEIPVTESNARLWGSNNSVYWQTDQLKQCSKQMELPQLSRSGCR